MTTDEFFAALEEASDAEREALATQLLKELSDDDRVLVESVLADALASMSGRGEVIKAPPGIVFD